MLRNATFSCVYECGKMYLPLHKMETHLEECRERFIECPKTDCKKAVKHSELDKHNEESHPIKAILDCKECNASFFEGEKHSCVSYVIALLKQIVGAGPFELAVKKLNEKYEDAE